MNKHVLPEKLSVVDLNLDIWEIQGVNVSGPILLATKKNLWKFVVIF